MKRAALSPSRVNDFLQCPLMFRLRVVDQIPEPPSVAATKGTLVHAVLEKLFDLEPRERTEAGADTLVDPAWAKMVARDPELLKLFESEKDLDMFMTQARALVGNYFRIENPRRLEPDARERFVEVELAEGILLRGFIDRIDRAPSGAVRIVDYKSGKAPAPRFSEGALFQMRFYALIMWRLDGIIPARLQLIYLSDGRTITLDPNEDDLVRFEEELYELWERIEKAALSRRFPPRKTPLCPWCSFQSLCPEFGGTTPPIDESGVVRLLGVKRGSPTSPATPDATSSGGEG